MNRGNAMRIAVLIVPLFPLLVQAQVSYPLFSLTTPPGHRTFIENTGQIPAAAA